MNFLKNQTKVEFEELFAMFLSFLGGVCLSVEFEELFAMFVSREKLILKVELY